MLYGSTIYLLVHFMLLGTPEDNLKKVWADISAAYKMFDTKHTYSSMKLTMLSAKGGIKLKGTAAEVRAIGRPPHHVWKQHMNNDLDLHKQVEICLRLGVHMEDILDKHPEAFALPGALHNSSHIL